MEYHSAALALSAGIPRPDEIIAPRFFMALTLPSPAARSRYDTALCGSDSDRRNPRLHMAPASPDSAAISRNFSASDGSARTPSPTMSIYPKEAAAWALPSSAARLSMSAAAQGSEPRIALAFSRRPSALSGTLSESMPRPCGTGGYLLRLVFNPSVHGRSWESC